MPASSFLSWMPRHARIVLMTSFICLIVLFLGVVLFVRSRAVMQEHLRDKLRSTAAAAAMQFDGRVLDTIHSRADMARPEFLRMVQKLEALRAMIPNIQSVYIMRRTGTPGRLEFVADADSLETFEQQDVNRDGIIQPSEMSSLPGDLYDASAFPRMIEGFERPSADDGLTTDQWGTVISGYAPITRADNGKIVAILGIDMDAQEFKAVSQSILSPVVLVFLVAGVLLVAIYFLYSLSLRRFEEWRKMDDERAGLMLLTYHQLGEPLSIFKWSLEALKDRDPDVSAEEAITQHVYNMESGIRRMDGMINDLKQAAEVQEGRIACHPEQADLKTVIHVITRELSPLFEERKHKLHLHVDPFSMRLDSSILRVILRQLLINAVEYSPERSDIAVHAVQHGRAVQISVEDHGCGIPQEDMPKIFTKFMRGSNAARIQPDGNGLGLFIASGFAERAGGKMWVESEEGRGTTVFFTLPLNG
ncbi:MAG: signal transduction histidine-protein kinase BaeS [Candidatus Peregrinibacteria bacterium Greene0416_19]|nr:MAG: signal transduction histidine-protein kinase BaeS [Candidatus Peregrinibacteria bacterium Greene0416_19]